MPITISAHAARSGARALIAASAAQAALMTCDGAQAAAVPPRFAPAATAFDPATAPVSAAAQAAMIAIPGGRYPIGRDDGPRDERPAHAVTLEAFRIDRTEVTNAAFVEFLNALGAPPRADAPAGAVPPSAFAPSEARLFVEGREGSGLYPLVALDDDQSRIAVEGGRFTVAPGFEDHPVTETTWAGARAYCAWRGARLPSEAEWEAAARGADGRLYPWGDARPDAARVHTAARAGDTAPVGRLAAGASAFGALDMSGGLAEWTASLKRPYPYDAADGREDPDAPGERVTRGGDYLYDDGASELTATHRDGFSNAPERGHRHIGLRCAL